MSIYYYASHMYQFSSAMPLYREMDGVFLLDEPKQVVQFKKYFRNGNFSPEHKSFFKTPPVLKRPDEEFGYLNGIIIFHSNVAFKNKSDQLKSIFIGNGAGDEKYGTIDSFDDYDYNFISGPKHLEKLKDMGVEIAENKLIKTGNIRFDDYVNNKIDKEKVMDRLGIKDRTRKNILYAPNNQWSNGTLLQYAHKFATEINKEHNLIIRPHYHDRGYFRKLKLWAKLHNIKHVYFSNPAEVVKSDIMHDITISDLLISDTSSILYEYLITGNPIIVIKSKSIDLHNMPDKMNIMTHVNLYHPTGQILKLINSLLNDNKSAEIYKNLLDECFYFNDGKSVERAKEFIASIS